MPKKTSATLFVILAEKVPVGVIFRRGPSRQVLLLKWDLKTDKIEAGQWLKGRIYERRSDLSPNGKLLLYFAGNFKEPFRTWTALSRPPYLTALALWPKGNTYGGGGLFEDDFNFRLNHGSRESALAEGFKLGNGLKMGLYEDRPGWGEDHPLYHSLQLKRDWILLHRGKMLKPKWDAQVTWRLEPPKVYEKSNGKYLLRENLKGIHQKNDSWYWLDYAVFKTEEEPCFTLERADWADFDGEGNLLFAKEGKLYRLNKNQFTRFKNKGLEAAKLVMDLNPLVFQEKAPPEWAKQW